MRHSIHGVGFLGLVFLAAVCASCTSQKVSSPTGETTDFRAVALAFTKALTARGYDRAYRMTSQEFQKQSSQEKMRQDFERCVPLDWGPMGPIEVGETMLVWPDRQASDLGWAYVSIGGQTYSEAVTVVVTLEAGQPKIRQVEYGRP